MEQTFIMVKPDGVQRRLIGKVIQKFENKGLRLLALKFVQATEEQITAMYHEELHATYFPLLLKIMTAGPAVPMVWEGPNAVACGRKLISELVTELSLPGTIRGDFCIHVGRNVCHAADNYTEAVLDCSIWFPELKI